MTIEEIKAKILEIHQPGDTDERNRMDWAARDCFNAKHAEILPSGDVWIERPMTGQVLDDDKLERLWSYISEDLLSEAEPEYRCRTCGAVQEDSAVLECDECA
jgi:hypothetical protein